MKAAPLKFGTSGWRAVIAEEFTFSNVRLAVAGIAEHVHKRKKKGTVIVGYDTRFFSPEFARMAAQTLAAHGIQVLLCDAPVPTPVIACEILRRKCDGAVNFTASHNPAAYNGIKFSGPHGGPALPQETSDIEARIARLAVRPARAVAHRTNTDERELETISPRGAYLKRLGELVDFETIREARLKIVCDVLHGCGAGYLDGVLTENAIPCTTLRAERDVLFNGTGPDVSEENLASLREAVRSNKANVGLATDGDADRFGILDADGTWIQPNHILGLIYDYLVETRRWKLPVARSVATSQLVDAVARYHGTKVIQTPVGFKFIGELIRKDKIALGGEESAGLSIRGHVPEKDGILACLLVAEMIARRGQSLRQQLRALFKRVGAEYWPLRANLHLNEDVKSRLVNRLKKNFREFAGRSVKRTDRTDGLKLELASGSWILLRLSGTEPLVRLYTEAHTADGARNLAKEAQAWIES